MNKMARYDRVVYEHFEDGFYIVHDEGWTEEEWMAARKVCVICDAAFVNLTADGMPRSDDRQRYCSQDCYIAGRRLAAKAWQSRKRAA